jgi:predicted TIM-barrel fold metal-dependent hydrolase
VPFVGEEIRTRPTIDIHAHVISTDTARYPNSPLGGHKSDWSRERPVSAEQMIASMDQAGIAKSALVQASTCYGHDNSYVADAVAAHPDRFTGVFSVDVLAPDAAEKIRYWVERKLTGMRLFTAGSTMPNQADWVDDPRSFPAWECASELKLPICMQMTVKAIPQLMHMLERFPKVPVVLDHLAKPILSDGPPYNGARDLFRLADYKNVYLKVTPRTVAEAQNGKATHATFFPLLTWKFGASRISWGSNYPTSEGTLQELLKFSEAGLSVLTAEDRDWIFGRTALTLYPVLAGNEKQEVDA